MEKDKADRLSDRVEERAIAKCAGLYTDALRRCMRRFAPVFKQLEELETRKPPSTCQTPEEQEKWRTDQRRTILLRCGMAKAISREVAAAGAFSADVIRAAMDEIDRINRVGDDIG